MDLNEDSYILIIFNETGYIQFLSIKGHILPSVKFLQL